MMQNLIGKGFFNEVYLIPGEDGQKKVHKIPRSFSRLCFGEVDEKVLDSAISAHQDYLPIPKSEIIKTFRGFGIEQEFIDGEILTFEKLRSDKKLCQEFHKICLSGIQMQKETKFYFDLLGRNSAKKQLFHLFRMIIDHGYIPKNLDFSNFLISDSNQIKFIDIGTLKNNSPVFTHIYPTLTHFNETLIKNLDTINFSI